MIAVAATNEHARVILSVGFEADLSQQLKSNLADDVCFWKQRRQTRRLGYQNYMKGISL
jgi:hypothetical protein